MKGFRPIGSTWARRVVAPALGGVVALLVAACGGGGASGPARTAEGGWDAVVAAAKQEGSVTIYALPTNNLLDVMEEAWAKAFPDITLTYVRLLSADQVTRVEAEVATNQAGADGIINGNFAWIAEQKATAGFFQPIVGPNATSPEAIAQGVLAQDRLSARTLILTYGFAWNKRTAGGDVSWDDITSGKYQGKVGLVDWCTGDAQTRVYYLMSKLYGGDDYFRKLMAASPLFFRSTDLLSQAVTSGEVAVGVIVTRGSTQTDVYSDDPASSEQIGFAYPPKGVIDAAYPGLVLGNARNPNAAQVYFNWTLSPEVEALQAKGTSTALVGNNIPGATLDKSTLADTQDDVSFTPQQSADYRKHLSQIFNRPCAT